MLPISVVLTELQDPKAVVPVLSSLHSSLPLWQTIGSADQKHLVAKTLNLARSSIPFRRWFGVNVLRVLADNYDVVSSDGPQLISQLLKLLDQCGASTNKVFFHSVVDCIDHLADRIRGKPTLTRELLTPNLPAIIGSYLEKFTLDPAFLAERLAPYIRAHPTTFRPFGNKLRAKVMATVSSQEFPSFPQKDKDSFCGLLSTLSAIEKIDPEERWANDLNSLLGELVSTVEIYGQLLNFEDDSELRKNLSKIPKPTSPEMALEPLSIDINEPASFYCLSNRIDLLLQMIRGYLSAPTTFVVRVPIGLLVLLLESVLAVNTRFISFKRELRDEATRAIIRNTLQCAHVSTLELLGLLPRIFRGSFVSYLKRTLGTLETLVPTKKNAVDSNQVLANEHLLCSVFQCVSSAISLVKVYQDSAALVRFIDAAMVLVQNRTSPELVQTASNGSSGSNNTKAGRKKKRSAVPLADLLSHQHLFQGSTAPSTTKCVHTLIRILVARVDLPTAQHNKVCKYIIVEAMKATSQIQDGIVPSHLRDLLVSAVLHPAFETTSIFPIVCSILPEDELLSVFKNPRFPPLLRAQKVLHDDESEHEDEAAESSEAEELIAEIYEPAEALLVSLTAQDVSGPENKKRRVELPTVKESIPVTALDFSSSKTTLEPAEQAHQHLDSNTPQAHAPIVPQVDTAVDTSGAVADDESESDFEMPEIQVDSDGE